MAICAAWRSVLAYVLIGTYIGVAALAHDFGFSLWWVVASTLLLWVAPGQVILISALGAGATALETAVAVGLSSARLLPMVVSLLPLIKERRRPTGALILPAHLTAVSMWIEAQRLLPALPRAMPHSVRERPRRRLHDRRPYRHVRRLLSRRRRCRRC